MTPFEKSKLKDEAHADLARAEYDMEIVGHAIKDACHRLSKISRNRGVSAIGRRKAAESLRAMKRLSKFANKVRRK